MYKTVTELIGKPLLTRGGAYLGCVRSVQTDTRLRQIRNLECFDKDEEEFLLPVTAAEQYGSDAVIVRGGARRAYKNCIPLPLKCAVFSQEGKELGKLDDFVCDELRLTHVVLSDGSRYETERLARVADAAVLDLSAPLPPANRPAARQRRTATPAEAEQENKRSAETEPAERRAAAAERAAERAAGPAEQTAAARAAEPAAQTAPAAAKTNARQSEPRAGSALLTGKILPADLLDAYGNVLAPAGTRVTEQVIRRALAHNKLFALTLLCGSRR